MLDVFMSLDKAFSWEKNRHQDQWIWLGSFDSMAIS